MKIFSVSGYFNDDHSNFDGYLVAEFNQTPFGYSDEQIFFYGLSETQLIGKHGDFTITSYTLYDVVIEDDTTIKKRLKYLRRELRAENARHKKNLNRLKHLLRSMVTL